MRNAEVEVKGIARSIPWRFVFALGVGLAGIGCTSDPAEPPTPVEAPSAPPQQTPPTPLAPPPAVLASIVVAPAEAAVPKGGTRQFTCAGFDQIQRSVSCEGGSWSVVVGGGTASISPTGVFTALSQGAVTVRYATGGVVGSAAATVLPPPPVNFVLDGASNSVEGTWPQTFFAKPELEDWKYVNVSVSGQTIIQMAADFETQVVPLYQPGKRNIYFASSGPSNMFTGGSGGTIHTGAQVFAMVEALAVKARAAGFEVWVATMLDRTQVLGPLTQSQLDAARLELNTMVRGMRARGTADVIIDWAAVPQLGANGAANDLTYFSDGIHTTRAGQVLVMERLLSDGVAAPVP